MLAGSCIVIDDTELAMEMSLECPALGHLGGVAGGVRVAWMCLTILAMLPGFEARVMMVVTPADVASRAATIFVDIPPVPSDEPAVETSWSLVELLVLERGKGGTYHRLATCQCLRPPR